MYWTKLQECSVLSNEQTFTNKLCETLESNQQSTIWKRDKYYNILNKIKTGEKENKVDYHFLTIFLINIQYDIMYWTKL
jgi:hypothetical protein